MLSFALDALVNHLRTLDFCLSFSERRSFFSATPVPFFLFFSRGAGAAE